MSRLHEYVTLSKLGEGAFGEVFKARHVPTGQVVALKHVRIRRLDEGLPRSLLREIKALELVDEPGVVGLHGYFPHGSSIVLVLEYMETDLQKLLDALTETARPLMEAEVKTVMQMLLRGAAALHEAQVVHRDVKPSNLLFSPEGELKLGDFGLARVLLRQQRDLSHEVATRWYRAPELLYGARQYGNEVDIWAIGCVFAEMLSHAPLFPGENDIDQLFRVLRAMGSPTAERWPEAASLPDYSKITFPDMPPVPLDELLPDASASALGLLRRLLVCSPGRRASAREALSDPYFTTEPLPVHPSALVPLVKLPRRLSLPRYQLAEFDPNAVLDVAALLCPGGGGGGGGGGLDEAARAAAAGDVATNVS